MYDKPPTIFKPISLQEKHNFFCKLGKTYQSVLCDDGSTKFTKITENQPVHKTIRPGIIVSSTSWTEDEDFSVLFKTLKGKNFKMFKKYFLIIQINFLFRI